MCECYEQYKDVFCSYNYALIQILLINIFIDYIILDYYLSSPIAYLSNTVRIS